MHKLNVLLLSHQQATVAVWNASDNLADAKRNLHLAVVHCGVGSNAWLHWQKEVARHNSEWLEAREHLRRIDSELGYK